MNTELVVRVFTRRSGNDAHRCALMDRLADFLEVLKDDSVEKCSHLEYEYSKDNVILYFLKVKNK